MARSRKLQVVEDDDFDVGSVAEVGRHKLIEAIPVPNLPLNDEGQAAYWKWAKILQAAGTLTEMSREICEGFGLAEHDLSNAIRGGKSLRYPSEQRSRWLRKLEKLNVGHSPQAQASGENTYARFGFAQRARERRHDPD